MPLKQRTSLLEAIDRVKDLNDAPVEKELNTPRLLLTALLTACCHEGRHRCLASPKVMDFTVCRGIISDNDT